TCYCKGSVGNNSKCRLEVVVAACTRVVNLRHRTVGKLHFCGRSIAGIYRSTPHLPCFIEFLMERGIPLTALPISYHMLDNKAAQKLVGYRPFCLPQDGI